MGSDTCRSGESNSGEDEAFCARLDVALQGVCAAEAGLGKRQVFVSARCSFCLRWGVQQDCWQPPGLLVEIYFPYIMP